MFFKNANEGILKRLEEKLNSLEQDIGAEYRQLQELNQNIGQLQTSVHKHDMAIEDLLEEWDLKKSDEDSIKEQFKEYKNSECQMLTLFEAYQEQFWNLKRFTDTNNGILAEQIALMEKNLEQYRQLCGISIIGETGIPVDYDLHEVIEAADTTDSGQDKLVAVIYRCGYLYKGKVKKKAQVSAYRYVCGSNHV